MRRPWSRFAPSRLRLPLALSGALAVALVLATACADCHGESAAPRPSPDWVLPGRSLAGVASRPTLWGGRFEGGLALLQAITLCASRFQYRMRSEDGSGAWQHDGDDLAALAGYLQGFVGPPDTLPLRRTDDVDAALVAAGDPDRGEAVWARSCAVCHGDEAEGGLAPPLDGADTPDPFTLADYVRQGADVDDAHEWMQWFTTDDLSTQDLADLIARYCD